MRIRSFTAAGCVAAMIAVFSLPAYGGDATVQPSSSSTPSPHTVSPAQMARIDDIDALQALINSQPDRFGGISTNGDNSVSICDTGSAPDAAIAVVVAKLQQDGANITTHSCAHNLQSLNSAFAEIGSSSIFSDNGVELQSWVIDPANDDISVGVSAIPTGFSDKVAAQFGGMVSLHYQDPIVATYGRYGDEPPFKGGDQLLGTNPAGPGRCTSGFTAHTASGAAYMITAGHCFDLGSIVTNGNLEYGGVDHRSFNGGNVDAELIGGKSYTGHVFTQSLTSPVLYPVKGWATWCQNCYLYTDGAVTGEAFDQVQDAQSGCIHITSPAYGTYYTCGIREAVSVKGPPYYPACAGGDSGGPVYAYNNDGTLEAIGIVTGVSGAFNDTCWYTEIYPILVHWSLTLTAG